MVSIPVAILGLVPVIISAATNGSCSQEAGSLLQVRGPCEGNSSSRSCSGHLVPAAVDGVFKYARKDLPDLRLTKNDLEMVFETGCPPGGPLDVAQCSRVKNATYGAYRQILSESHEHLYKHGYAKWIEYRQSAVLMMFVCMYWNNDASPVDTCTEEERCSMITDKNEYDEVLKQQHSGGYAYLQINGTTQSTKWGNGWPGTGDVNPIVRVSLLHKSDGSSASADTLLGTSGLRLSVVNGGWATAADLQLPSKYDQEFQIAWGPIRDGMLPDTSVGGPSLKLQSGLAAAAPGSTVSGFSNTAVKAKMPPAAGSAITMAVIGDPCVGNMVGGGQCIFRAYYGVNKTLPTLLNAALPSVDVWYMTGDNFYDRYGIWTVGIFAQLSEAAQGTPLITTPGNHDYWQEGVSTLSTDNIVTGYDQFANGFMQFYAQDTAASFAPAAPPTKLIQPSGTSTSRFTSGNAFFDFSANPGSWRDYDAKPSNFYHYSIAGNVGFVVFTCVGKDPKDFVAEACTFMKTHNPDLVLFMGHYNKPGDGCDDGTDVPAAAKWALDNSDCSAFKGSGQAPYGPSGTAASRLKFLVGHNHCNCMTNFDLTENDQCLEDDASPGNVDGFIIGSHGMSWDPQSDPKCSARFGLPVLNTDNGKLVFSYAKLSLDTTKTHCSAIDIFCKENPGEVSRTDLWSAFLGTTPSAWEPSTSQPYGKGILTEVMENLLKCLADKGTLECSRDASLFDVWYSSDLV